MYDTTQELKSEEFMLNKENIKQEIGIQLSFFSEVKLKKEHLLVKYLQFFSYIEASIFNPCYDKKV